jgi:hypothetical protein
MVSDLDSRSSSTVDSSYSSDNRDSYTANDNNDKSGDKNSRVPMRDPAIVNQARKIGLRLEKFENAGIEEQAVAELTKMMDNGRKEGFLAYVKGFDESTLGGGVGVGGGVGGVQGEAYQTNNTTTTATTGTTATTSTTTSSANATTSALESLFLRGSALSEQSWRAMLERQAVADAAAEDLSLPPTKLPINLKAGGLAGGVDIFEGNRTCSP